MSKKVDEDDGLVVDEHFSTDKRSVVLVLNEINNNNNTTTNNNDNKKNSSDLNLNSKLKSKQSKKSIQSTSSSSNNRMHPINNRIRSVFEIFRNRLNTSSSNSANSKNDKKNSSFKNTQQYQKNCSNSKTETNDAQKIQNQSTSNEGLCQLCYTECSPIVKKDGSNYMFQIETCEHSFCIECLRQYLKYQIIESRVSISCPECSEKMHPSDIYKLLKLNSDPLNDSFTSTDSSQSSPASPQSTNSLLKSTQNLLKNSQKKSEDYSFLIQKYEDFMLRRVLVTIPDTRWCPAPDCTYAVIATGCANCPQLQCMRPNCNTSFCYHCKQYWHPNLTCEDAAIKNNQSGISAILNINNNNIENFGITSNTTKLRSLLQRSNSHISQASSNGVINSSNANSTVLTTRNINGDWVKEEIKRCPKCQALIVKMDDGSCNHITCSVCGCEFCWLCMKEISDLHYLSPSGCTFWGKKPWSRKKKILWQLGTLIGAPVGIALIAGVAAPAILIGLPIWAGRKVYIRYKTIGNHKRNLIVVSTVFGTILVAPLVAALAVGIGVPILLAYVYGVVPISLCRSGGCGVTTNNNGGVRFAFDDENTENQNFYNYTGTTTANNTSATTSKKSDEKKKYKKDDESIYFNSVTVPISAIDPKPEGLVVLTHSNQSGLYSKTNSKNVSKKTNENQTPLFVTITMANNNNTNSAQKNQSKSKNRNHSSSSSSNNRKRNSSRSNKTNKITLNPNISASVTCGSVELPLPKQNNKSSKKTLIKNPKSISSKTEIGTSTAVFTIKTTKNKENLNSDFELNTSSSSSSSQNLLGEASSNKKSSNQDSKKTSDILLRSNSNKKNNNSSKSKKQLDENQLKKLISTKIVNNPSIGEMSIGIASLSATSALHYYEQEEDDDDDNEEDCNQNDRDSKSSKQVYSLKNNLKSNEDRSDRDSASNKAIASESINIYSIYLTENASNKSDKISNENNLSFDDKKSLNNHANDLDNKIELKSTYTINSFEKPCLTNDMDTYSVSILSEKSINPSVSALVGSIK